MEKNVVPRFQSENSVGHNHPRQTLRKNEITTIDLTVQVGRLIGVDATLPPVRYLVRLNLGETMVEVHAEKSAPSGPFPEQRMQLKVVTSKRRGLKGLDGVPLEAIITVVQCGILDKKTENVAANVFDIGAYILHMISKKKSKVEEVFDFSSELRAVIKIGMNISGPNNILLSTILQTQNASKHVRFKEQTSEDVIEYDVKSRSTISSGPDRFSLINDPSSKIPKNNSQLFIRSAKPKIQNRRAIPTLGNQKYSTISCEPDESEMQDIGYSFESSLQIGEHDGDSDDERMRIEIEELPGSTSMRKDGEGSLTSTPSPLGEIEKSFEENSTSDSVAVGIGNNTQERFHQHDARKYAAEQKKLSNAILAMNDGEFRKYRESIEKVRKRMMEKREKLSEQFSQFLDSCISSNSTKELEFRIADDFIPEAYKEKMNEVMKSVTRAGNHLRETIKKCEKKVAHDFEAYRDNANNQNVYPNLSTTDSESSQTEIALEEQEIEVVSDESPEQIKKKVYEAFNANRSLALELDTRLRRMNSTPPVNVEQLQTEFEAMSNSLQDRYLTFLKMQQSSLSRSKKDVKKDWDISKLLAGDGNKDETVQLKKLGPEVLYRHKIQDYLERTMKVREDMEFFVRSAPHILNYIEKVKKKSRALLDENMQLNVNDLLRSVGVNENAEMSTKRK